MKNIVIFDEYNEIDLKPSELLRRYIELTEQDVREFLALPSNLHDVACPACGLGEGKSAFVKFGLQYRECQSCHTLYISPRPDDKAIYHYYLKSRARCFWRDELSRATDKKRKEKIIKPRFQWILESTQEHRPSAKVWVDVNTSQYGYIDAMIQSRAFDQKILLNPYLVLDPARDHHIRILQEPWWTTSLHREVDVISIFEVANHTSDIHALFSRLNDMLRPGGLCFMTAILASGFDVQILWDKAENIYPPDRMNAFTIEGLKLLFERHGFECLEFSTPGILDVEIVAKSLIDHPGLAVPRFVRNIIENRDEDIQQAFQEFLQASLLSSYGRILLRKC